MITTYTYQITHVRKDLGAMEIVFSAPGYPDVLVGARMPYADEDLDAVVATFAPLAHWASLGREIADVQLGHSGSIDTTAGPPVSPVSETPETQYFSPGQTSLTSAKTTPLQFMSLFTDAEKLAITAASLQSPEVRLWYDQLIASTEVVNTDPRIAAGLDSLVVAGLLTQERRDVILPPTSGLVSV